MIATSTSAAATAASQAEHAATTAAGGVAQTSAWLLIALPFVLLAEILLAGWSTHRRNLRVDPVSMTG